MFCFGQQGKMRVYLAAAVQFDHRQTIIPMFEALAAQDKFGVHALTSNPEDADIILFVDPHQHSDWRLPAICHSPLARQHRAKTLAYDERDQPYCALPGLYVSMPKPYFDEQRQRACCYVTSRNSYIESAALRISQPDYLFSFLGRRCHPTREIMLGFTHPRSFVQDTSDYNFFGDTDSDIDAQQQRYAEVLARSKFVLCPRGAGPASYRLFETLAAGRVPVIVSDEWVAPDGPDWNACSLRVREADVLQIPALLEANEARYAQMARAARCEWEQWFASDVLFHRMVESCRDIIAQRRLPESVLRRKWDARYMRLRLRELKAKVNHFRRGKPLQ